MKILILEHEPLEGNTNIDIWARQNGVDLQRVFIHANETLPPLNACDLLVVAGGSQQVWEASRHPWMGPEKDFVRKALAAGRPVLGICLGSQILAEILGGRVFMAEHPEIGWHRVTLSPSSGGFGFFGPDVHEFTTFHWHYAQFTLPPDCIGLASSAATPHQAFVSRKFKALALQFHPEFSLATVRHYAATQGDTWPPGPFVTPPREFQRRSQSLPDTYPLMKAILDALAAWN